MKDKKLIRKILKGISAVLVAFGFNEWVVLFEYLADLLEPVSAMAFVAGGTVSYLVSNTLKDEKESKGYQE